MIDINFYHNKNIFNSISSIKIENQNNLCWFCAKKCFEFVKICKECEYEKKNKKKSKDNNKKNL